MTSNDSVGAATSGAPPPPWPRPNNMGHHLVAVPYPGRGHVNPMMNLCRLLSHGGADGLLITFVVTEEWLGLIDPAGTPSNLRLRCIPNVLPAEGQRGADFGAFVEAVLTRMAAPFEELLGGLRPPPTAILADTLLPWAAAVGRRRVLPLFSLWTQAASVFAALYHLDLLFSNPLQGIPGVKPALAAEIRSARSVGGSIAPRRLIVESFQQVTTARCLLLNAPGELEPGTIDALGREQLPFPVLPVGPCVPTPVDAFLAAPPPTRAATESADGAGVDYFSWLDSQARGSVLYASLGSLMPVPQAQMEEIGMGLRASGARYLWVARGECAAKPNSVGSAAGLVVPWCDQPGVLRHPAVGGFLTHCGWNSTMEALWAGVPMLAFPLGVDQFCNSNLVVDEWRVGLRLRSLAGGEGLVGRGEIAESARTLMDPEGAVSRELRARAMELGEVCRGALRHGGSSARNLEAFVMLLNSDVSVSPDDSGTDSPPEEEGVTNHG